MTLGLEKLNMAEVFMEAAELLEIAESLERALCPGVIDESREEIQRRIDDRNIRRKAACHFLYAIVFELTIKIIWAVEKGRESYPTHKILQLYNELSCEKQSIIKDWYDNQQLSMMRAIEGEQGGNQIRLDDLIDFQPLEEALEINEETMIDFKYDGKFPFERRSSAIGSVMWNDKRYWILPPGFVVFPRKLLKYAKECVESLSP